MLNMLIGWIINIGALLALPYILSGVSIKAWTTAALVAVVLGFLNIIIKPILIILTLPINIISIGLFTFVINGFLFWLTARMIDGFNVASFWWAVAGAIVYSLITWAVSSLLVRDKAKQAS
jgi:putative membrane protein